MKEPFLKCPMCCNTDWKTVESLRDHLIYFIHRPLICKICSASIEGISGLIRHLETHCNVDDEKRLNDSKCCSNITESSDSFMNNSGRNSSYNTDSSDFANFCDKQPVPFSDQYELQEGTFTFSQDPIREAVSPQVFNNNGLRTMSGEKTSVDFSNDENQIVGSQVMFTNQSNSETIPSDTETDNSLSCSYSESECDELSRQTSECSQSRFDNGDCVRAFVCKICGVKVVGQDFYFKHLQENCKLIPNKTNLSNQYQNIESYLQESQSREENYSNLLSTHIESSSYKEGDLEEIDSHPECISDYSFKNESTLTELTNVIHPSFLIEKSENFLHEESFNSEPQGESEEISEPFFNPGISSIEIQPPVQNLMLTSSKSPSQPYIHKKFDHDQDRKPENASSKNAVQCYIQNFQSILVNKLNQAFENNQMKFPFNHDIEEEPNTDEKETLTVEGNDYLQLYAKSKATQSDKTVEYTCKYCAKSYIWKQSRDTHERSHTTKNTSKCKYCHKVFVKPFLLYRHLQELHSDMIFYCNLCGRQFKSFRSLTNHKGIHEKKRFGCSHCSYFCHTGSGLRTHIFEAHSSSSKEILCPHCGEKFKKKYGLNRHIKRKHKVENLSCRYCDKDFPCKEDLNHHLNTHLHNKSLTCSTCNQIFSTLSSLKRHSVKHKKEAGGFTCDKCAAVFTRKDSLLSHSKLHAPTRAYICKCGKGFNKQSQLKYHAAKHSNKALFSCERCSKSYKFKVSLRNHVCKVEAEGS